VTDNRDKYDALFDADAESDYRDLMGAADIEPGLERGAGFLIQRTVRASVPWAPSGARSGPVRKPCKRCGSPIIGRAYYCGSADCKRVRATERKRASRMSQVRSHVG